jgi:hypothetical protein
VLSQTRRIKNESIYFAKVPFSNVAQAESSDDLIHSFGRSFVTL